MTKQLMTLFLSFSLVACYTIPKPDTDLCGVNAELKHQKCYNLKKDYGNDGHRLPNAQPTYKPAETVMDLNKNICTDPKGFENFLVWGQLLQQEYQACMDKKRMLEVMCGGVK